MTYNRNSIEEISTMKTTQHHADTFSEAYGSLTPAYHPQEELVTRYREGKTLSNNPMRLREKVLRTTHFFKSNGTSSSSFDVTLTETEPMSGSYAATLYSDSHDEEFIGVFANPAEAFEKAYNLL